MIVSLYNVLSYFEFQAAVLVKHFCSCTKKLLKDQKHVMWCSGRVKSQIAGVILASYVGVSKSWSTMWQLWVLQQKFKSIIQLHRNTGRHI